MIITCFLQSDKSTKILSMLFYVKHEHGNGYAIRYQ
ncbi:Hypothetical protein PYTT_1352 [Akkermansia glycaniphila]|uniref:Uncharacterized protein n=1 Tax=Akkermansia glycaniphila TaxID=1679444 RepID=A0A1H6LP25_9BACT|nr:Hypothetical protein PYTT_1352 [Akkermansia glycaniphila]